MIRWGASSHGDHSRPATGMLSILLAMGKPGLRNESKAPVPRPEVTATKGQ